MANIGYNVPYYCGFAVKKRKKRAGIWQNAEIQGRFFGVFHMPAVRKMLSTFEMKNAVKVIDPFA